MTEGQATERSDAELIALAQTGESEAFGELYRRYLDPIYRYIRVRVGENRLAEDLSEMVFLRSFESLGKYKERGHPFSAYLYRVARNLRVVLGLTTAEVAVWMGRSEGAVRVLLHRALKSLREQLADAED